MKRIPKEGDQVWDPAEEFTRRELKYRRDRPYDSLAPVQPLVQTNEPLGEAGEKQDPESHDRVRQILGLTPEGASLESSLASFNPTFAQLSELQEIMRTELRAIKDLIADVDPVELPTMTEESTIIPFDHPQLTEMERQALGAHTIGGAVQYVKQDEAVLAGKKHYFVDRNIIRAYREFYSPWIAIWLYALGNRLLPAKARTLATATDKEEAPVREGGDLVKRAPPDGLATLNALVWHRLYVESAIWYAVLACQEKKGAASPADIIKSVLFDLVRLGRELKGHRIDLDPGTVRLLSADGVPYGVVRSLVELSNPDLYQTGLKERTVRDRLDGITNVVVTAWRDCARGSEGRDLLASVLLDTHNVQRVFAGRRKKWRQTLHEVPNRGNVLKELEEELLMAFVLALEGWKPETKTTPFTSYLAKTVELHPWSRVIEKSKKNSEHLEVVEDYDDVHASDARFATSDPHGLFGVSCVQETTYVKDRGKRFLRAKEQASEVQLQVADAYEQALREGHTGRDARKVAMERLKMKSELFRRHLSDFRGLVD